MSAVVEFFVVVAGQPNVADSEIVLARAGSARQAAFNLGWRRR